jgi:RNA polymerase sigma factor (sigma-70 family)
MGREPRRRVTPSRRETQEPCREAPRATPPRPGQPPGDGGASVVFEEAYLRFAPRLRKIAVRKFHIQHGEAETLVHDVFATFLLHAASVQHVEPYLIGAICNAARHYLRRSDAADALFCAEVPCLATADDAIVQEVERKLLVSRLLGRVGVKCRELLERYYVHGDTTHAIAAAFRSTPGSILVLLHQCRKRARAAFPGASERP